MDTSTSRPAPRRSAFAFLTWWRIDDAELDRQVENYGTLKITFFLGFKVESRRNEMPARGVLAA